MQIEEKIPDPAEYCALRITCGLSAMSVEAAKEGLPKSLYAVTLRDGEKLIGMGRVVGDGLHVQVVDIAVVSLFADVDWLCKATEVSRHVL